jgi:mono/diheme cytochrome c family protein
MEMPAHRGELSEEQVGDLVAHVRAFAPTREKTVDTEKRRPALAGFDKRYQRLQREMNDVKRQYHDLPKAAPGSAPPKPSEPGQHELARQSPPAAPGAPNPKDLFLKRCAKCHGEDGTGRKARERLPEIPDFTNPSWQARQVDSKLLASILDGKDEMPSWRDKISQEQARSLVAQIRAFAPNPGSPKGRFPSTFWTRSGRRRIHPGRGNAESRFLGESQ